MIMKGTSAMRLVVLFALLLAPSIAPAATPEEKGRAIAIEMDHRDQGWVDQQASLLMVLRNKHGQESTREIRVRSLEIEGDGDKSLTIFDTPADVKGTAFLSFSHALKADDQWLYLPALKRVKRISSANKSGPFMGSEFAYEDLASQEIDKYTYKWLRDESLEGRETMVIERIPQYEHSGYTRQVVWVDSQMWQALKVEYYDRKNALLKTLTMSHYQRYLDRHWRADSMRMVNHQTGKSTELEWSAYRHQTGLSDRDFDRSALKRVR